jgi:hypothetical protein
VVILLAAAEKVILITVVENGLHLANRSAGGLPQ